MRAANYATSVQSLLCPPLCPPLKIFEKNFGEREIDPLVSFYAWKKTYERVRFRERISPRLGVNETLYH